MIRCVVFDFDGTLVDSNFIKRQAFYEVAGAHQGGAAEMDIILREAVGRDRCWIFDTFAQRLPKSPPASVLAERYNRICEKYIVAAPEIEGSTAALMQLKAEDKRLFVNSATPVVPLATLIKLRQIDSFFDGIRGAPESKEVNLHAILAQVGCRADELVMVGDGETDRLAAELVGCHFVAIEREGSRFMAEPRYRTPDLTRLATIILELALTGVEK